MLRAIGPEGELTIDGIPYAIGGLRSTSTFRAYCNRTGFAGELAAPMNTAFAYVSHTVGAPVAPFPWAPGTRHSRSDLAWPPQGVSLTVSLAVPATAAAVPASVRALRLTLTYELYEGMPLLAKWVELTSTSAADVIVDRVVVDLFAANARFGSYSAHGAMAPGGEFDGATSAGSVAPPPLLHAKTDQAHGAQCAWLDDFAQSSDPVPGCPTCEPAVEPAASAVPSAPCSMPCAR